MNYTVYKTTNKQNNKVYIGKHQTNDLNDGYLGSGKHLKRAIKKYGLENFKKKILYIFDNESEMNAKEAELVTEDFCKLKDNYNLCKGGSGGFGYINSKVLSTDQRKLGRVHADQAMLERFGPDYRKEIGQRGYAAREAKYSAEELIVMKDAARAKARLAFNPGNSKRVIDDSGNVFNTIKEYAKFHNITPDGATHRLKKGRNIRLVNAGVA